MLNKTCLFILSAIIICALPFKALAQSKAAPADPAPPSEIQKTISLLEDETKRAEVVRLLKLMEAMEAETAAIQAGGGAAAPGAEDEENWSLKRYFQFKVGQAWRMVGVSGIGLRQSLSSISDVMGALATADHFEIWRPYFLKAFSWGLMCIALVWVLFKKFGKPPKFVPELKGRILAALRFLLLPTLPSALLILSLAPLPVLATTAKGVTADLATGFEFLHSLIQHFFISLGLLSVFLRLTSAVLRPDAEGHSLAGINPLLSLRVLHSINVVAIYLAAFVFIKGVVLEYFVVGALYSLSLILMTIPVPIYLTLRILKMGQLVRVINDTEIYAAPEALPEENSEPADPAEVPLEHRADCFIRHYWPPILIILVWLLEILAIANPADAAERFVGRLMGTAVIVALAAITIALERRLMLRLVKRDSENGHRLLLSADTVSNVVVWLGALAMLVSLWGMPLDSILRNPLTREILGRAFAIAVTVLSLIVFLKFSSLATAWLMSSKELYDNRNMRTMLPLVLTVVRTMAVFIGVVVILERLGVNVGPILAGAGILSLGVGMGAQTLVKDVINGISILLMNTISVGDYVTMAGKSGTVEFLGLRTARLRDTSGNLIIVPNSSVTDIVNMTRDYSQELVELPVPADVDLDAMLDMTREVAGELSNDPVWKLSMTAPVDVFGVSAFNEKTSTIRLRVNAKAGSQWAVGRELRLRLRRRTREEAAKSPWFSYNLVLHNAESEK